jgi:hypothetical protein
MMPKRHGIAALQAAIRDETGFPALRTGLWNGRALGASGMSLLGSPQAPTGLYPIAQGKRQRRPGSWANRKSAL